MGSRIRMAVQIGAATVRVAVAGPRGDRRSAVPQVVAELPRGRFSGLAAVVAAYAGTAPAELVLVHPAGAAPETVAADVAAAASLAAVVRAVPAPVAAAVDSDAVAVLDAGHSGIEVTLLGPGGGHARHPGGGAVLDAVLAGACPDEASTALRERLSLLPVAGPLTAAMIEPLLTSELSGPVAALRAGLDRTGADGPVLLVGGLARTPLLAALVDAAGVRAARVPERPEAAAVLGALRIPSVAGSELAPQPSTWLPPAVARSVPPRRRLGSALAALVTVGALLAAGRLMPAAGAPAADAGIVQYGYRMALPAGWQHTGGLPDRRRTLLTPGTAPQGSDLVAVEASPLGYDPQAEPQRAARELRAVYEQGVAGGAMLGDYDPSASYAGRSVTAYRQRHADGIVVDWYVLFERDTQLSVGCQHTATGAAAVAAACATVVATLHRT